MEDRRDIDPAPPARGPAEAAAAPLLQQAIKVDRDLRRGLVRLPGLARMSPVSREAGSGQGSQVPHKTPQVRVPSMFPTRIPRIKRHSAAHGGTAAKWPGAARRPTAGPGAATVLAAAAARALVAGLCAGRQ